MSSTDDGAVCGGLGVQFGALSIGLEEGKLEGSNADAVAVAQEGGLGDAFSVKEDAVAAAHVDEAKSSVGGLALNDGVAARDSRVGQGDVVAFSSSDGANVQDAHSFSIGEFHFGEGVDFGDPLLVEDAVVNAVSNDKAFCFAPNDAGEKQVVVGFVCFVVQDFVALPNLIVTLERGAQVSRVAKEFLADEKEVVVLFSGARGKKKHFAGRVDDGFRITRWSVANLFGDSSAEFLSQIGMAMRPIENSIQQSRRILSASAGRDHALGKGLGFGSCEVVELDAAADVEWSGIGVGNQLIGRGDTEQAESEAAELGFANAAVVTFADGREEFVCVKGQAFDSVDFIDKNNQSRRYFRERNGLEGAEPTLNGAQFLVLHPVAVQFVLNVQLPSDAQKQSVVPLFGAEISSDGSAIENRDLNAFFAKIASGSHH